VLVFTRTKHGANRLAEQLERDGLTAAAIHGNKSQGARTRALAGFKTGAVRVLVATDIAARGLDIDQLPHVVNYELPNVPEDYVHRIGRTGRAGREGQAVSLVCVDEHKLLRDIERLLKRRLPQVVQPGYTPDPSIDPQPIQNGRGARGGMSRQPQPGLGQRRAQTGRNGARSEPQTASGEKRRNAGETRTAAASKRGHGRRNGLDARPTAHRHARRSRPQETAALLGGGRDD
jgi:ATP-dependent RNA helicase RhlE